jgi:hypothetical protein
MDFVNCILGYSLFYNYTSTRLTETRVGERDQCYITLAFSRTVMSRDRCYDFLNIFAETFSEKNWRFWLKTKLSFEKN